VIPPAGKNTLIKLLLSESNNAEEKVILLLIALKLATYIFPCMKIKSRVKNNPNEIHKNFVLAIIWNDCLIS
jgi:hypothetical protein